jgi:hypothetical protein
MSLAVSRRRVARACAGALALLCVAVPGASAQNVGPDYVASDNVELVDRIKTVGDGVGARLIGKYLYVTTTKSLNIFDIATDPEHPREVGLETLDIEFENEEVPTNGKLLGISSQIGCKNLLAGNTFNPEWDSGGASSATGCLSLYDVSNPAAVRYIKSVSGSGDHTATCVFDCTYFLGSTGSITDARDPANAERIGNWQAGLPGSEEFFKASCHHLREIQPGLILGSCQPIVLMSVRPEDGGSITKPVVLATGTNQDERFIHSSRWPNGGADKFVLSGGETNASGTCDDTVGAFMVWDASAVIKAGGGFNTGAQFKLLDEIRPTNGNYVDGHTPVNGLGCSVHWFHEHPTFSNGGLVALAEYENGTRLLQITPEGKIVEKDFFLPLAGSSSAPHWNPNGKVFYSIDYARGVDVVRYTGPSYAGPPISARTAPSVCASASGFRSVGARAAGSGVRFTGRRRASRRFDVDVFQQSRGRTIIRDRLRARFKARNGAFTWSARRQADGFYYARFTMRLRGGGRDVRIVALRRSRGRFRTVPAFRQSGDCGAFRSFALSRAVFGGRRNAPLGISYRLAHDVEAVRLEALVGKRVVRRFEASPSALRTFRFSLPARSARAGQTVKVRATILAGGRAVTSKTLTAHRL